MLGSSGVCARIFILKISQVFGAKRKQPQGDYDMTLPKKIEIVIYDAPAAGGGDCGCGCGGHHHGEAADPLAQGHMELQTQALGLTLESAFPGRVQVEYINVLKDPRGPALPQTQLLSSGAYPSPLVYLNGQGRFAGSLPVERIREEVGKLVAEEQ